MSLEQSIQNLADAINNLAKSQQFASLFADEGMPAIVTGFNQAEVISRDRDDNGMQTATVVEKSEEVVELTRVLSAQAEKKAEKAKPAAAEKPVDKQPEPVKAEEPAKTVEGEVITANEKTEEEIRQEAFGAPDGYIYKPFMALPYAQKEIIAEKFGGLDGKTSKKRISLVPLDQIPVLKAAVEAALAEVQG